jgi:hypothetical protein
MTESRKENGYHDQDRRTTEVDVNFQAESHLLEVVSELVGGLKTVADSVTEA